MKKLILIFSVLLFQLNYSFANDKVIESLKEGDKLHLVVKKEASPAAAAASTVSDSSKPTSTSTTTGCIETQTEIEPKVLLEREMTRILKVNYC